jgi:hypothetical protein
VSPAELVLSYERAHWRARGAGVDVRHAELRGLEQLVEDALAVEGAARRVHVRFDTASLPVWLRQYHTHYCNYVLTLPERSAS